MGIGVTLPSLLAGMGVAVMGARACDGGLRNPANPLITRTGFRLLPAVRLGLAARGVLRAFVGCRSRAGLQKVGQSPCEENRSRVGLSRRLFDVANTLCENALRGWCLGMGLN